VRRLIIFVKAPRLGTVKTRLAGKLGKEGAISAYMKLVEQLVNNLLGLKAVQVRYAPDDGFAEIQSWLQPGWTAALQGEGDLGERLHFAFESAFAEGFTKVVIIGSDCPYVTQGDIEQAWEALEKRDVVLGPAQDGGYWLIGLRKNQPLLFQGIPWSTDQVFAQTLQRAKSQGLSISLLQILEDIDTLEGWERFAAHKSHFTRKR
jgi:rSAM/selenodomain-associated transferase 1